MLLHSSASQTSKQAILHADQVPIRLSRINYLMKTIRFLPLLLPRIHPQTSLTSPQGQNESGPYAETQTAPTYPRLSFDSVSVVVLY